MLLQGSAITGEMVGTTIMDVTLPSSTDRATIEQKIWEEFRNRQGDPEQPFRNYTLEDDGPGVGLAPAYSLRHVDEHFTRAPYDVWALAIAVSPADEEGKIRLIVTL